MAEGTPVAVSRHAVLVRGPLDALRQSPVGRRVVRELPLRVTRSTSGNTPTRPAAPSAAPAPVDAPPAEEPVARTPKLALVCGFGVMKFFIYICVLVYDDFAKSKSTAKDAKP